jgi:hypothetical protein
LIAQALEAEFEAFLASTAELVLPDGRRRVVRHGHDSVRAIQTGIGPIELRKSKARDRAAASRERIRFMSNILRQWRGAPRASTPSCPFSICAGFASAFSRRFSPFCQAKDAPNFSAAVIARLKSEWEDEYQRRQKRSLSARHYVYVWADGGYLQARMEPQANACWC